MNFIEKAWKWICRQWADYGGWCVFILIVAGILMFVFSSGLFSRLTVHEISGKLLTIFLALLAPYATFKISEANYLRDALAQYATKEMCDAVRLIADLSRQWTANAENIGKNAADGVFVPPKMISLRSYAQNSRPQIDNIGAYNVEQDKCNLPWTKEQDSARRMLKHYFLNNLQLYRAGRISKGVFKMICKKDAIGLLFTTVEVMELILNQRYDDSVFHDIMDVTQHQTPQAKHNAPPRTPCFWNPATKKYEAS